MGGGDRENSDPLDGGQFVAGAARAVALVNGPTLFDNPADTTLLFGAAIGRDAVRSLVPGPTVLDNTFRAGSLFELILLVITDGFAAKCFGAPALSARVILFGATQK